MTHRNDRDLCSKSPYGDDQERLAMAMNVDGCAIDETDPEEDFEEVDLGEDVERYIEQAARRTHLRSTIRKLRDYQVGRPGDTSTLGVDESGPLARDSFWRHLDPTAQCELLALGKVRRFSSGENLYQAGDDPSHVYIVFSGWIKISMQPKQSGYEVAVAIRGPGDIVGEVGALCGSSRTTTATARGEVSLLVIHADLFASFLRAQPAVVNELEAVAKQRLRESREFRQSLEKQPGMQRLALIVLAIVDRFGERIAPGEGVGSRAYMPLDSDDFASLAIIPASDVDSILERWMINHIIQFDDQSIAVLDQRCMHSIANGDLERIRDRIDWMPFARRWRYAYALDAWERFKRHQMDLLGELEQLPQDAPL